MKRLGLGSYACAWEIGAGGLDAVGLIERACELGVRVVQIADNLPLCKEPVRGLDRIRGRAEDADMELELGTRGIAAEHIQQYLELCKTLRAHLLRVVMDAPFSTSAPDEIVGTLRKFVPRLQDAEVTVAIENHDRFPTHVMAQIVEKTGDPAVGICLDTVNSFGAMEGPEHVIETLGAQTVNLHLKDFVIAREAHNMGFRISGAPAGQGMLQIPQLLARLDALGATGNVILELWPPPESTTEASIAKERRWCRESIEYLRTLIAN